MTPKATTTLHNELSPSEWILQVDGSSNVKGNGKGIYLKSPTGEAIKQSFRLGFKASNNEAEYEVMVVGLQLTISLGARRLKVTSDSQLIVNQVSGECVA